MSLCAPFWSLSNSGRTIRRNNRHVETDQPLVCRSLVKQRRRSLAGKPIIAVRCDGSVLRPDRLTVGGAGVLPSAHDRFAGSARKDDPCGVAQNLGRGRAGRGLDDRLRHPRQGSCRKSGADLGRNAREVPGCAHRSSGWFVEPETANAHGALYMTMVQ